MNTYKIFNLIMALIFGVSLLGLSTSVSAQEPMPYFSVHPEEDAIPGWWGWPIGTPITFSVDNPGTPEDPDYAGTTTVTEESPNDHSFLVYIGEFIDIKPGFEVVVSDGVSTKSTIVTNLQITMANPVTDTISGTAEPGSTVISQACEVSGCKWDGTDVTRTVIADSSGNWVADYSVMGGSGEPIFDILPGANIWHTQNDEDGDSTRIQGRMPRPGFMLNIHNDSSWHGLDAWNWPLGSQVTLTVDDPDTLQNPDYTEVQTMAPGNDAYHPTHAMYMQNNEFEGQPGFTITLSDGAQTKTGIVSLLAVTGYDLANDTINGVADPFMPVTVACAEGIEPTVITDSEGNWLVGFRVPENPDEVIFDIKPGVACEPQIHYGFALVLRDWSVRMGLKGFYQPVDMNEVFNIAKGGSTVPFKFEIFAGSTELTDIADVLSFTYVPFACTPDVPVDTIETTAIGGTSLRYDAAAGQFVYNWKTPKVAEKCYQVTLTTIDGSTLVAYFKFK